VSLGAGQRQGQDEKGRRSQGSRIHGKPGANHTASEFTTTTQALLYVRYIERFYKE
jgi:hypothetical protein